MKITNVSNCVIRIVILKMMHATFEATDTTANAQSTTAADTPTSGYVVRGSAGAPRLRDVVASWRSRARIGERVMREMRHFRRSHVINDVRKKIRGMHVRVSAEISVETG